MRPPPPTPWFEKRPWTTRDAVDACAKKDGLLLCPEGGATLAAYTQALANGLVDEDERVILFNCATGLKYPLPPAGEHLDLSQDIDLGSL